MAYTRSTKKKLTVQRETIALTAVLGEVACASIQAHGMMINGLETRD